MDDLCKLGYVAAEYLLEGKTFAPLEMGMLLANAASSLHTDIRHQQLIDREGDQAASPAVFTHYPMSYLARFASATRYKGKTPFSSLKPISRKNWKDTHV